MSDAVRTETAGDFRQAPSTSSAQTGRGVAAVRDWGREWGALLQREAAMDAAAVAAAPPIVLPAREVLDRERVAMIRDLASKVTRTRGLIQDLRSLVSNGLRVELHQSDRAGPSPRVPAQVTCVRPGEDYIQEVASLMSASERQLSEAKSAHKAEYTELAREEEGLLRELDAFWREFETREAEAPRTPRAAPQLAAAPSPRSGRSLTPNGRGGAPVDHAGPGPNTTGSSGLHPDVQAYDDFLASTGGATGGWHEEDHQDWLRILETCKGDYSIAVQVQSFFLLLLLLAVACQVIECLSALDSSTST